MPRPWSQHLLLNPSRFVFWAGNRRRHFSLSVLLFLLFTTFRPYVSRMYDYLPRIRWRHGEDDMTGQGRVEYVSVHYLVLLYFDVA